MIDLPNLIERIEAATGPDRALDAEIAALLRACGLSAPAWVKNWKGKWAPAPKINAGAVAIWSDSGELTVWWNAPHYTSSVDVAMTLIPEDGWLQHLGHNLAGWNCRVERQGVSRARKTQALAVCAAALKARNA